MGKICSSWWCHRCHLRSLMMWLFEVTLDFVWACYFHYRTLLFKRQCLFPFPKHNICLVYRNRICKRKWKKQLNRCKNPNMKSCSLYIEYVVVACFMDDGGVFSWVAPFTWPRLTQKNISVVVIMTKLFTWVFYDLFRAWYWSVVSACFVK